MIDAAFESLVHQRQHVVLSSDRPLSLQHSALLLMHRLQTAPNVRVAAEAPLDPTELIEHVNKIVAGLSVRQATDTDTGGNRLAVLPVRVGADRPADAITLLARLCRALPGSGLRLMLIVEHRAALADCLSSLGSTAFHWNIGAAEPGPAESGTDRGADPDPLRGPGRAPLDTTAGDARLQEPARNRSIEPTSITEPPAPSGEELARDRASAAPPHKPEWSQQPAASSTAASASASLLTRLVDSASRRPLKFALWVAGIPGLLIAGVLAIGSALQPSRPAGQPTVPAASSAASSPAPSGARTPAASGAPPARSESASSQPATAPSSTAAAAPPPAAGMAPSPSADKANPPSSAPPSSAPQKPIPTRADPVPAPSSPATAAPAAPRAEPAAQRSEAPAAVPVAQAASAPAPVPANPAPAAPPAAGTQEPAAAGAGAAASFECSPARAAPPQLQPRNPSKDGGMVYLTSNRLVVVCVTDGSGVLTRAEITPDQPRSFFGKAPWQVQASSLRDLQVFFQGARITLPRTATDRIELIEQRLN